MDQYPFMAIDAQPALPDDLEGSYIELEVLLHYDRMFQKNETAMPRVCFRLGEQRLYYLYDFRKLFLAIKEQSTMTFGQSFTFDGAYHRFHPVDSQILDLVKELVLMDDIFSGRNQRHMTYQLDGIIEDKWLHLPEPYLMRLFTLLEKRPFKLEVHNHLAKDTFYIEGIRRDLPPCPFHLEAHDDGYLLTYTFDMLKLSHNMRYLLQGSDIYKIPVKKAQVLKPLFNGLYDNPTHLMVPDSKKDHFIGQVLPLLKEFGDLSLDASLEASIVEAPLVCEIFLDKKDAYIVATIRFNYNEYEIDPFHDVYDPSRPIIIRDMGKEDALLNAFSDFVIRGDGLYLLDEEKSYDFLTETLPKLLSWADVFYTDAFKAIRINATPTIRSSVRYHSSEGLLEFSFDIDSVDKEELSHILHAVRLKKKYYRMKNGSYMGINNESMTSFASMLDQLQINQSDLLKPSVSLPPYRAFTLDDYSGSNTLFRLKREQSFRQLINEIHSPEELEFTCPKALEGILRDYQLTGFKWLKTLAHYGFGGILADDMGLGKTLQTLAFIISEYERNTMPTLIVAPTSLVYNWHEEILKFVPDLPVIIIDGPPATRAEAIEQAKNYPIVITSYPLIRRDIESYESIQFAYCIIDEAQHIKNPSSLNAQSVKRIHANGYFALTGTPIENHLLELWSIFDFVMPQLLYSHSKFSRLFEQPIMKDNDTDTLEQLKKIIRPFILRRLKSEVLKELPDKIEMNYVATMTDAQKKLYLAYLEEAKSEVLGQMDGTSTKRNPIKILSMITRLRQISCHPGMFVDDYTGGSGKLELLMELIHESIESGHRILVFSQFTSMLGIIRDELAADNIRYAYLDGKLPSIQRKDIIHAFNHEDIPIFLISLKAGGTGLNLTSADVVIHVDPWWNPAVEDQATDRAYRIGQNKNVQVIKMLAKGTIEEKIYQLQQRKKALANSIIESGENFIHQLNDDDIHELFDLGHQG